MYRELYRFGGVTFALESDAPLERSPVCEAFRVPDGVPDHTICLRFSDALPTPPADALRRDDVFRWQAGAQRHLLQWVSAPGDIPHFTYAVTHGAHTDVIFASAYRTGAISARKDHIRVRTMRHGIGKVRNIPRCTDPLQKMPLCARLPAKHIIAPQRVRRRCGQRIAEPQANRVIRHAVRHTKRFAHRRAFERRIRLQREGHAAEAIKLTVHRSQTAAHSHLRESGWYSCSGSRLPQDL